MEKVLLILAVFTAITSFISAVYSLINSISSKKNDRLTAKYEDANEKIISLQKELYRVYKNVDQLLQIEENLSFELDYGKKTVRQGYDTDRYIQPKHVKTRIEQLELEIKSKT